MKRILSIIILSLFLCPAVSSAIPVKELEWEDLIPEKNRQEDPLVNLEEERRGFIEWIIYLRQYLPEKVGPDQQEFYDEMVEEMPKLKAEGFDVDQIIADRKERESAINTDLDGKVVQLAGYFLPLDFEGEKIKDFLLVPWVGACIHTPPPPPNQIIHATLVGEIEFNMDEMFKPVSITGKLSAKSLSKDLYLVDGSSNVDIGYQINVQSIEPFVE